jgi:hypothetical protein
MSGYYKRNGFRHELLEEKGIEFLQKPFNVNACAKRLPIFWNGKRKACPAAGSERKPLPLVSTGFVIERLPRLCPAVH